MKLLGLELVAFGPFTNVELDFVADGVHVVYGKNEAGKSTALRAITGLLYGIPKSTPDAHLHRMPDLRVGGRFRAPGGGTLQLIRRKGKENTLLDRDGRPVDESVLTRLLAGVSQEQFLSTFGLDHQSLRRGGDALLLGQGNVGESLFGAAVAGGEVHRLLRTLRAEADALFTPKAHTRPLNEALRALTEAHRRTRDESMSADSILEQRRNLEQLLRDRADCEKERQRLHVERSKLERARRALPMMAKRKVLEARRAAIGPVTLLAASASSARIENLRVSEEAASEAARLRSVAADLEARRAKLVIFESLVEKDKMPLDLANRLGSHRKAAEEDLPRMYGEIEELESQARALLRETGRAASLENTERWRIDAITQAAIRKLGIDKGALERAKHETQRTLVERRARRSALLARREMTPPAADVSALKKAITATERDGSLEERLAKTTAQAKRIEQRARVELSALGLGHLELEDACGLTVPSLDKVERSARRWAELEIEEQQLAKDSLDLESQLAKLTRDIRALELVGKVPTEDDLTAARERRDDVWRRVRKALSVSAKAKEAARSRDRRELASGFEEKLLLADQISDRLRREAERVGKLAALLAERDVVTARSRATGERKGDLSKRRGALADDWQKLWQKAGVDPGAPSESKAWLLAHAALLRTAEEFRAFLVDAGALRVSIDGHRQRLFCLLEGHDRNVEGSPGLAVLLDRAQELVDVAEAAALERREIDRDLDEIEGQVAALVAEEREQAKAQRQLDDAWTRAISPLGVSRQASPEDVILTIDLLAQMFHKLDQAAVGRRRATSLERDAQLFARDVENVARQHATDLVGRPAAAAAEEIIERYHRGQKDLTVRREIDRQLADARRMLAAQTEQQRTADALVARLMSDAAVDTIEALKVAERKSDEVRDLDRQTADVDAELLELGIDSSRLPDEIAGLDPDDAAARLDDVDAELEQLRQQASMIDQRIGGVEKGQRELENPQARAADAALEAEAALAKVRDIAHRYVRVKIAAVILAREIERYRRENQGPILTRGSALFRRLTLGSFAELRTDFDEKDQPILLGVRGDGRDLRVEAMSDGTRDQLYLALRLATLERIAGQGEPMPFIVDDILVHFDDDRARAALEVLGELSQSTQVLFFTHHARLVELAREAIPPSKLFVRELSESLPVNAAV